MQLQSCGCGFLQPRSHLVQEYQKLIARWRWSRDYTQPSKAAIPYFQASFKFPSVAQRRRHEIELGLRKRAVLWFECDAWWDCQVPKASVPLCGRGLFLLSLIA